MRRCYVCAVFPILLVSQARALEVLPCPISAGGTYAPGSLAVWYGWGAVPPGAPDMPVPPQAFWNAPAPWPLAGAAWAFYGAVAPGTPHVPVAPLLPFGPPHLAPGLAAPCPADVGLVP
jgi:hypothetical protein